MKRNHGEWLQYILNEEFHMQQKKVIKIQHEIPEWVPISSLARQKSINIPEIHIGSGSLNSSPLSKTMSTKILSLSTSKSSERSDPSRRTSLKDSRRNTLLSPKSSMLGALLDPFRAIGSASTQLGKKFKSGNIFNDFKVKDSIAEENHTSSINILKTARTASIPLKLENIQSSIALSGVCVVYSTDTEYFSAKGSLELE